MNKTRKQKLINYLFYNNYTIDFMFNDFYVELNFVLPRKICFSKDNIKKENRVKNLEKAKSVLKNFLESNVNYYNKLKEIYYNKSIESLLSDVLAGYILYLTPNINKNSGADVYADKRSVCYSKTSIIDTLIF